MTFLSSRAAFAVCAALAALAGPALAGECPADKIGVDLTRPTAPEATKPKGLTDTVLSAIDLAKTGTQFAGYQIRIRKLTIEAQWSAEDLRVLPNSVSLGPFCLVAGTFIKGSGASGTITREGLQVIAWMCEVPPVLPPAD